MCLEKQFSDKIHTITPLCKSKIQNEVVFASKTNCMNACTGAEIKSITQSSSQQLMKESGQPHVPVVLSPVGVEWLQEPVTTQRYQRQNSRLCHNSNCDRSALSVFLCRLKTTNELNI